MAKLGIHDLAVRYGKLTAISDLSFTVAEGERVFVSGPNGAGKSSLLSAIAGAVRAAHGRIEMDGEILSGLGPEAIARRGLSMVPEGRRIFPSLSVLENLMVGTGMRRDRGAVADDLETVFTAFPILRDRARSQAGALSGGQQQMLAIARALMSRPKLLLLDEPSLGLAPLIVKQIFSAIKELNAKEGLSVFLVEQNAFHALKLAHRGYVMVNGRITMSGTGKELLSRPEVRAAYLEGGH